MTSPKNIHETIARMRRRVLEIDTLIASIERGCIPAHVIGEGKVLKLDRFRSIAEHRDRGSLASAAGFRHKAFCVCLPLKMRAGDEGLAEVLRIAHFG